MTKQMTIDMDALLERATADCLDSSDLEEFCAALIRRIITLETASRAILPAAECGLGHAYLESERLEYAATITALARELGAS
jgi:hypothetical protein